MAGHALSCPQRFASCAAWESYVSLTLSHPPTHSPTYPPTAASPLGSEEVYLTNTREDNSLAKTAKMLAFPPSSAADRLAVLLRPLAAQPPMSHLTSMALLEAVAAVAVGEFQTLLLNATSLEWGEHMHSPTAPPINMLTNTVLGGSHTGVACFEVYSALLRSCMLQHLSALCCCLPGLRSQPPSHTTDPGARTTDPALQDAALQAAAALGRPLFALFNHPASRVADGTAVIMRAIAERGAAAAAPMRDASLREGALLHHLQLALFATGVRERVLNCCRQLAGWSVMLALLAFACSGELGPLAPTKTVRWSCLCVCR
jgi:hypothetical protein